VVIENDMYKEDSYKKSKIYGVVFMLKKIIFILLIITLCGFSYIPNANSKPNLNCVSGVVIDQNSGRILFNKNGDKILPMASTTKIITAIVAIENGNLRDIVTVSKTAAIISGSTVGLKAGEKVTLEELLYGLILRSGNDAAIAIAEHIGGSVVGFAKLMNEKAIELGAFNTSFVTPHGLDKEFHYTTAEDLAKITAYAMNNQIFARISCTKSITAGISGRFNRGYLNINKFLYKLDNADGVKTGYTGRAGKCLVASVRHNNGRYISVVFNSKDRWNDAEKMIKYAENNYKYIKIDKNTKIKNKFRVYGGNIKYVNGITNSNLFLPVLKNDSEIVDTQIFVPSSLFSPIYKNDHIGNLVIFINDKIVAKFPIFSRDEVKTSNKIKIRSSNNDKEYYHKTMNLNILIKAPEES
jgi:serine-type D-Ala-D-Ala carboxypeptidase (penicillin-binding protein 5/6)